VAGLLAWNLTVDRDDPEVGFRIAERLGLERLPDEGGLFRRTYSDRAVTAIYYLVAGKDVSAMHRLRTSDELYFHHAGAPLELLLLEGRKVHEITLCPNVLRGQQPQQLVRAGTWQGSRSAAGWTLVSTVVAPGFEWSDFELADSSRLIKKYPDVAEHIRALTR
jgi:predicted cupin superfamily sugar epimerase